MPAPRPISLLVPALVFVLAPSRAPAGEPLEPLDTATGARAIGPAIPPSAAGLAATERPQRLGAKILYLNFDGQQMSWCGGSNDPHNNCSTIFQGTVLPFSGDAAKRASIVQVIRKRIADFGITVTDQRPGAGDYDMEMVGNWQGQNPEFAGIAPNIDCFDSTGGETSFTLEASGSSDGIAEIVLQELAHTWGLEHVNEKQDLLYPTTEGLNKTFQDTCHKIVSDTDLNETNGYCNQVHTQFCNFGWQNSYQELLYLFGESVPDTIAPTVTILEPADGAVIEGGNLSLVIALEDDQSPAVIATTIVLDGDALPEAAQTTGAFAAPHQLTFPIQDLPDGSYVLHVAVTDESDNPADDEVSFTVVGNPADADDTGSGEGSDGGSGGVDGGSGEDAGSGGADGGSDGSAGLGDPQPTTDDGCNCRTEGSRPGPTALLLGLLALVGRRRRR